MPYPKKPVAQTTQVGTGIIIAGLCVAYTNISTSLTPSQMANQVAIAVGIALALSIWFDSKKGLQNLFRVDIICLVSLYYLTLVEFLLPQNSFNTVLTAEQAAHGLYVILIGIGSMALGRHFNFLKPEPKLWSYLGNLPDKILFRLFIISALLGYLYILMSVDFNVFKIYDAWLGPRFAVPWARGRLGDWRALLSELKLFSYVIPPLAGIIWNRRQSFQSWQIFLVMVIFAITLFDGFAGGTRNVLGSYFAAFLGGYFLTLKRPNLFNLAIPSAVVGYAMMFATRHMLGFRNMGILRYLETGAYATQKVQENFAVDYNLGAIGIIVDAFPQKYNFLGFELLYVFASKPIPRALWPGKPEGLSISIEEVTGAAGWTVSTTYIGEAYMMGGVIAVILMSLSIGMLASWWTRTAAFYNTGYGVVINALGFFTGALAMRSIAFFTTSILPILALIFFAKFMPSFLDINKSQSQYPYR
ncbi:hypothetical protein NOS3756_45200 [Nostoc sp. NIES-3756]|uniref:hypothetical protein n=1 Tax=Nostoc sp. NIES-3756 TaxID=1751286 RepID=UPI000720072B|nr:hypothetical protein [Nostoc sp. NIES-3756]BAT55532.1 hypothetical protein NOS3756_45200 [Nostoc sp. NIES-3756]